MAKKQVDIFEHESVEEYCVKPVFDQDGVQASSGIGKDGLEYPDPVPMAPPIGYKPPDDLMTMIRSMIRNEEFRRALEQDDWETFDEADDFDIPDDPLDPLTAYERVFEPPPSPAVQPPLPAAAEAPKEVKAGEGGVASPPPGSSAPAQSST